MSIVVLLAVESDPSATVGYFKKTVASNSWVPFSLPFGYSDLSILTVIGDQSFADGDQIADIELGTSTTYYDGFGWFGDLEYLSYGRAYWITRAMTNPQMDVFVLGTVDPHAVTVTVVGNAWTPFGLNEARSIAILDLPITGAVDGDQIADIELGTSTTYYDGFGWFGDLEYLEPIHAYWYVTLNPTGFSWTYTPGARDNVITPSDMRVKRTK